MGRSALRAHLQQLDTELAALRGDWQPVGAWRTFVQGGYNRPEYDGYGGGDGHGLSLSLGVTHRLSEAWLAGVSLGLAENSLELGRNDSDYDMRSYLATAFARYEYQRLFADFSLSAGYLDYHDLKRTFALGITERTEKGDTEGTLWGAAVNRLQPDAAGRSPAVRSVHRCQLPESGRRRIQREGARSTTLSYDDQELDSLRLSLGLFGDYALTERTRLFGEVATRWNARMRTAATCACPEQRAGQQFRTARSGADRRPDTFQRWPDAPSDARPGAACQLPLPRKRQPRPRARTVAGLGSVEGDAQRPPPRMRAAAERVNSAPVDLPLQVGDLPLHGVDGASDLGAEGIEFGGIGIVGSAGRFSVRCAAPGCPAPDG